MSLVFSDVHDWENDSNVKQSLVFSCRKAEEYFKEKFKRRGPDTFGSSHDTDCGAIFKLRAVRTANGKYESILRCGVTGHILSQDHTGFEDFEAAIDRAKELLIEYINTVI